MSNKQIRFKNCKEDVVIQCQMNELMNDIINQYMVKSGLSLEELCCLYNGDKLNMDITLSQMNAKNKEVIIIIYPKKIKKMKMKYKNQFIKFTSNTSKEISENRNEIILKVKIKENDINKIIYFLDNTNESTHPYGYFEKG